MKNKKLLSICIFFAMLMVFPAVYSQQSTVGCCINPGAGLLACSSERLVQRDTECCPRPESSNQQYYNINASGPKDYNTCIANFFFQGQSCNSVSQCQLGCCCSASSGEVKTRSQCSGADLVFKPGETNCIQSCSIPQCNDGIDNDNNGCKDFPTDSGCESTSDLSETNGICFAPQESNCESISYLPKIKNLKAAPVKGNKKIKIEWENECTSNLILNNIYRCLGDNCNDFLLMGSSFGNNYIDEDDKLKFSTTYTYKIESQYKVQTAKPFSIIKSSLGSLECWNRIDNNNFCIHESYYNQYKDHIISNFPGFSSQNFIQNVKTTFQPKLNKAFFCNNVNLLVDEGTVCSSTQVCVVSDNNPICAQKSDCNPDQSNIFGLFFTRANCENNKYCFYDRSLSSVDTCFACNPSMSCYDYKSKDGCEKNNCKAGNCAWKYLSQELGTGICIDDSADNCQWCDKPGTDGLESTKSWSSVFEQCTAEKANLLSNKENLCYYNGQKAINCKDVACTDYRVEECSSGPVTLNEFNVFPGQPTDDCSLGICQNFNGICKKNADGDNIADCSSNECERDVFAPNGTMVPSIDRGVYRSLSIEIYDKVSSKGSSLRRTTNDYKTYICKEPCTTKHPFTSFTNSYNLIISNLNLFDSLTGQKLLEFSEGSNTLRYYSQDPAKNIGKVKTLEVLTHSNSTGPIILRLNLTDGKLVDSVYYTKSKNPKVTIEFFEKAIVTSAKLVLKGTEVSIIPDFNNQLSKTVEFTFPRQINLGEYVFEVNAKNEKGIFMQEVSRSPIVVDDRVPSVLSIIPSEGTVIKSPDFTITITFDKKVNIDKITINGQDFKDKFFSSDSTKFSANVNVNDGNKEISLDARDFAGNQINFKSKFVVNAKSLDIRLLKPQFGIASSNVFDLVIGTDNDATCRYSLDSNLEFEFMNNFDASNGVEHKKQAFNEIAANDKSVHKLYARCNDPLQNSSIKVFDISVDNENPVINKAFAHPEKIAEDPRTTTLKIETNKDAICKFSKETRDFNLMEGKFKGFDNNTFGKVNLQEITVETDGSYSYFVACMAKSELLSETKEIKFIADIKLPLEIISHTQEYFNTTTVTISLETNKKAQCKYSQIDPEVKQGTLIGQQPSYGHRTDLVLAPGKYTYYSVCKDRFLEKWSAPIKIEFTIDTTAPLMAFVDDASTLPNNPEFTWQTDRLRAKWLGRDNETRVQSYLYTLEEFGTLNTIVNWTPVFAENEFVFLPQNKTLSLATGSKYFFRFRAKNIVGLISDALESNGVTVDPSLKPVNCTNNIKDAQESDIDCGGACSLCLDNKICRENADCSSGFCSLEKICKMPTCSDNAKNQDESDIDCGGKCGKCDNSRTCNFDSDCSSNSCSFGTCKEADSCSDGSLSSAETDIDCGGSCAKCGLDKACTTNSDCQIGLCFNGKCSEEQISLEEKDTDSDGIPDQWEIENAMDPNDPSDAELDNDNDQLTNIQEYNYRTNPNKTDTDGDNSSDKKEIDKGTDPLDPSSRPKGFLGTALLSIILLLFLGGGGYGAYYYYQKTLKKPQPRAMPKIITPQYAKKPAAKEQPAKPKGIEIFKSKEEQKKKERGKLLDIFGARQEPIKREEAKKPEETKRDIPEKTGKADKEPETGDTFSRLKSIIQEESQKKTGQKKEAKEGIKKSKKKPGKNK